jgi:hypothetical protein
MQAENGHATPSGSRAEPTSRERLPPGEAQATAAGARDADVIVVCNKHDARESRLAQATTTIAGRNYYCRQTLLICQGGIEHIFSPVSDAARSPLQVETWMLAHGW